MDGTRDDAVPRDLTSVIISIVVMIHNMISSWAVEVHLGDVSFAITSLRQRVGLRTSGRECLGIAIGWTSRSLLRTEVGLRAGGRFGNAMGFGSKGGFGGRVALVFGGGFGGKGEFRDGDRIRHGIWQRIWSGMRIWNSLRIWSDVGIWGGLRV